MVIGCLAIVYQTLNNTQVDAGPCGSLLCVNVGSVCFRGKGLSPSSGPTLKLKMVAECTSETGGHCPRSEGVKTQENQHQQ
jgi:hypothetical protein